MMMLMKKLGCIIIVALLMVPDVISTQVNSPALSPIEHSSSPTQSETEMSPPPSPSDSISEGFSQSPKMSDDYPSSSQFPEASDLNYTDITRTGEEESSGSKKTGIAVGVIAAASMVGFGGYVLKKRRENIRRSRYGYAATEFF